MFDHPRGLSLIAALITPILTTTLSRIAALLALGLCFSFLCCQCQHSRYCKARRSGFHTSENVPRREIMSDLIFHQCSGSYKTTRTTGHYRPNLVVEI